MHHFLHAVVVAPPRVHSLKLALTSCRPASVTILSLANLVLLTMSAAASNSKNSFYRHLPLQIKRLSKHAVLPSRGSDYAAGLDLSAAVNCTIAAGERALVKTDLSIACPPGTYARIAPRSGLAYKKGIDVGAGVIDADYRGPLGVILFNFGDSDFVISQGDRIAQLILEQIVLPDVVDVEDLPQVGERGAAGFGSTGVSKDEETSKKQRTISPAGSEEEMAKPVQKEESGDMETDKQ